MKVFTFTVEQLDRMGILSDVIELKGWNPWVFKEEQLAPDEEIQLTLQDCFKLKISPKEMRNK